jgi:hypothetical protein
MSVFSIVTVLPLVIILTGAPPRAASLAVCPAPVVAFHGAGRVRVVPVRVFNQSDMPDVGLARLIDVANRIWNPYGISFERGTDDSRGVVVVVGDRANPAAGYRRFTPVLGTTLFSDGHAQPYIHLSPAVAELMAGEIAHVDAGLPFPSRLPAERDRILQQILGTALAHEMAHLLLDTAHHSAAGLLRSGLRLRDAMSGYLAELALTSDQLGRLCDGT